MQPNIGQVIHAMTAYNYGCPELINHAMKVYAFARGIGAAEHLPPDTMETLEVAAVLHDIGIRVSEEKYQSFAGRYQQIEGPPIARKILEALSYSGKLIDRVCYLIAHHHEYQEIDGMDYQILVEADFLVNIYEENTPKNKVNIMAKTIFKTKAGSAYLKNLYLKTSPSPSLFAADLERILLEKRGVRMIPQENKLQGIKS